MLCLLCPLADVKAFLQLSAHPDLRRPQGQTRRADGELSNAWSILMIVVAIAPQPSNIGIRSETENSDGYLGALGNLGTTVLWESLQWVD